MAVVEERHLYCYSPLSNPKSTRIIKLKAGNFDDPLECSIHHTDLESDHESYVALSYRWGDPDNITTIICDGQSVSITVMHRNDFVARANGTRSGLMPSPLIRLELRRV
jgi:hypothetical protein